VTEAQERVDRRNAEFWDELCGTALARELGITDASPESLERFDAAYLDFYPYLEPYLPHPRSPGEALLEMGLGYGTVSQVLAERGFDYRGLDIAEGPVRMVQARLDMLGFDDPERRVMQGSALAIPHPDASFDQVVTIGCLHHTGDAARAVSEVHRVLRPGGRALVMVYNRRSYRRFKAALRGLPGRLRGAQADEEEMRGSYDRNVEGEAAPATEYFSKGEARQMFGDFARVRIRSENFDSIAPLGRQVDRGRMLGWPARLAGLDLYITAVR
jgi:SAM-dependent methyltransferase